MGFYRKPLEEEIPQYAEIEYKAPDLYNTSVSESVGSSVMSKNSNGQLTYVPIEHFAVTSSNTFNGNQTINGDLTINGNINANEFLVTTSSVTHFTASTNFGLDYGDTHRFTGSVYITGSFQVIGPTTSLGNTIISGSTKVDYIIFNSASASPLVGYMLQANTTDKTLDLRMGDDNATLQLGQEMYFPPVVNKSGVDLYNGDLVMVNPAGIAQGNRISVVKAVTDGTYAADKIVGILTEDVARNAEGFATWFGYVRELDKTQVQPAGETWAEGDILYPNPAIPGRLTKVFPTAPNLRVTVATITRINGNNITLLVNFHKRTALKRAHDVLDNSTTSSYGDILVKSGSVWTNSKTLNGDYKISGSLFISGTTELGGNIVPKFPSGSTLGTLERPFREIFVSSGSINIASDIIGEPNTSISNTGGNLLISAGGVRLIDPASFIAATGSFQYLSGSFIHIGNANRIGNTITTGSSVVSGSQIITGSLDVKGNISVASGSEFYLAGNKLFNYGQFSSTITQSGSINTANSMKLNSTDIAHNISVVSGSRVTVENTGIYNIQFSAQLHTTANETCDFSIWFAMTGSSVANSNTEFSIDKINTGGYQVAALNYLTHIKAGDYVELYWSNTTGNGILQYRGTQSTPTRPATPSVIVTVTQVA